MLRLLFVLVTIVPATLWAGGLVIWHAWRGTPVTDAVYDRAPRRWARFILWCSGARVEFENAEVIDPGRPQIVVANHTSWYDVLALSGYIPGRFVFVAKQELEKVPIFGRAADACGQIFIDRHDRSSAIDSLERARRILEETRPTVIMFPEGTRSPDGALKPFKKGAFVLAIQAGVEVVPAAITGSYEVMRKGSLRIRPGTITVRFGEPIDVSGFAVDDRNALTEKAWNALSALQTSRISLNEPS